MKGEEKSLGEERTVGGPPGGGGHGYGLRAGERIGQYLVIRPLGAGGMGEVYEVEHEVLRRRYALKVLPGELMRRAGALERFEREARVMANLEHANIVRVDEFGESGGRYWLRMELVEGIRERTEVGRLRQGSYEKASQ